MNNTATLCFAYGWPVRRSYDKHVGQKLEKSRFTRVDSDVIDNLIVKEDKKGEILEADKFVVGIQY